MNFIFAADALVLIFPDDTSLMLALSSFDWE